MRKLKTIVNILHSSQGYTLLSALIGLSILLVILPFTAPLLKTLDSISTIYDLDHLEIRQFDSFISFELNRSQKVTIKENHISFERSDGRAITLDQYQNQIRRQTNYQGHTTMMFDVTDFAFERLNGNTFKISFVKEGKLIEQIFHHYNISTPEI
ncbi:ComGF family competence protein [Alkalibacillus almallahensis]|uniref:ComGF family competence protein n=1 Tax=Alkalibacillus almallahensis TaxID=1379154 RepID=UPI00141DB31E|nr:ComGF family competence protein [Alkalibacillus almallahensis]